MGLLLRQTIKKQASGKSEWGRGGLAPSERPCEELPRTGLQLTLDFAQRILKLRSVDEVGKGR